MEALVFKVRGDTRLDEFFEAVERAANGRFRKEIGTFYRLIGNCVGTRLRLLHDNGQIWSYSDDASNAHTGNVVIFQTDDGNHLEFDLVDFDYLSLVVDKADTRYKEFDFREIQNTSDVWSMPISRKSKSDIGKEFAKGVRQAYSSGRFRRDRIEKECYDEIIRKLGNLKKPVREEVPIKDLPEHYQTRHNPVDFLTVGHEEFEKRIETDDPFETAPDTDFETDEEGLTESQKRLKRNIRRFERLGLIRKPELLNQILEESK